MRAGQGFLPFGAQFQGILQPGLRCRRVQFEQLALQLLQFGACALALVRRQLLVAAQILDARLDAALREFGFVHRALQLTQPGPRGLGLLGQGFAFDFGIGEP